MLWALIWKDHKAKFRTKWKSFPYYNKEVQNIIDQNNQKGTSRQIWSNNRKEEATADPEEVLLAL